MNAPPTHNRRHWLLQKLGEGLTRKQWRHLRFGFHVVYTAASKRREFVPLRDLWPNHQLDREPALATFRKRVARLRMVADGVRRRGRVMLDELAGWMPSGNPMLAIRGRDGRYRVFEGNGRLHALHAVFADRPDLLVEVKVFEPRSDRTLDRLERLSDPFELPAV